MVITAEELLVAAGFERRMLRSTRPDGRQRLTAARGKFVYLFASVEQAHAWVTYQSATARRLARSRERGYAA